MNRSPIRDLFVFVLLVTLGVVARVALQHIPNFAPVAALALFAGFFFAQRWLAVMVPLSVMVISDRLVDAGGYHPLLMFTVYGLLILPVALRGWLRTYLSVERGSWPRAVAAVLGLVGCSLCGSLLFFAGTNLMVWLTSSMYDPSWQGLVQCYASAIPFFRYTLAGDTAFALVLFGGYAIGVAALSPAAAHGRLAAIQRT